LELERNAFKLLVHLRGGLAELLVHEGDVVRHGVRELVPEGFGFLLEHEEGLSLLFRFAALFKIQRHPEKNSNDKYEESG